MRFRTGGRGVPALADMVRALREVTKAEAVAVVNRDGGIVAAELPRNVSQETFSIMCAPILGAGMTAATELGHTAPHRVLLESDDATVVRSEEHTSELQSPCNLVCRLLLEKKKTIHPPPLLIPTLLIRL